MAESTRYKALENNQSRLQEALEGLQKTQKELEDRIETNPQKFEEIVVRMETKILSFMQKMMNRDKEFEDLGQQPNTEKGPLLPTPITKNKESGTYSTPYYDRNGQDEVEKSSIVLAIENGGGDNDDDDFVPSFKPVSHVYPFAQSLTYLRTMATKPSAFDKLMAGESKKKEPSQQTQKPLGSQTPVQIASKGPSSPGIKEAQIETTPKIEESLQKKARVEIKTKNEGTHVDLSAKIARSVEELKKKSASFNPEKAAYWGKDGKVPFLFVAKALDEISNETGRIAITEIVCNVLKTVIENLPKDLLAVVYLLANKIAPAHEGLELGIGDSSIIKALSEADGNKEAHVKKQYKELGDLDLIAKESRSSQSLMGKPEALTVSKVFDKFLLIAKDSGKDSQERKKNRIKALLVAATDCEPLYLIRLLQAKLRIGLAEKTLLATWGHAVVYAIELVGTATYSQMNLVTGKELQLFREHKKPLTTSELGSTGHQTKRKLFGVDIFEMTEESLVTENAVVYCTDKCDELGSKQ